jgi:cell wall-associated NlpC family hydrolase
MLTGVNRMRKATCVLLFGIGAIFLTGCQTGQQLHAPTPVQKSYVSPYTPPRGAQLQPSPGRKPTDSPLRAECYRWLGVPYRVGGETMAGADCSGFTLAVYKKVFGLKLPRTSITQYNFGAGVSLAQLREGDLVFFKTSNEAPVTHVGIYLGQGKFIHSSSKRGVTISRLNDGYYSERFRGARRVLRS